jgi:uncharacterized protein YbbC (DUF1343 family)
VKPFLIALIMRILTLCFLLFLTSQLHALEYGIDRLKEPAISKLLENKKLAVLTHAAAKSVEHEHLIDILFKTYSLKKIFAPEHGLRTTADDWVGDGVDEATGLPVISLYKSASKAPKPEDLIDIDAIVIDLQDVGVRYYTYFSTIASVMKVASKLNIEIIILDRPNLLGGIMEGKVLDPTLAGSFTAYHTVPTRHGMTLGELALMVNVEKNFKCKLTVVSAKDWFRENLLFSLNREWIPPSPALIEVPQVGLYALWGILENFNLAVGRGQTNELAFKVLGAPWISPTDAVALARDFNAFNFKGMTFSPFSWIATRDIYENEWVNGVLLTWDGSEVRTDEFTYKVASHLVKTFRAKLNIHQMSTRSYGSASMVEAIKKGVSWDVYKKVIDKELLEFQERRIPYLLYP